MIKFLRSIKNLTKISYVIKKFHLFLIILIPLFYLSFLSSGPQTVEQEVNGDSLGVLPLVIKYVNKYYVDKPSIDPKIMLINGMGRLERVLDEVVVDFPQDEKSASFNVQVLNETETFKMSDVNDLETLKTRIEDVFTFIQPRLSSQEPKIRDVEYAVIDEMLKTLDPHSAIITPDVYQEFMIETEGSFGGLGIVIGIRDAQLTVISPIEGTPAHRVGIKPNDKIAQIEMESTINMSLIEAVSKLRGKKGTKVNIYVNRDGFSAPKRYEMVRDTINIESVETFDLGEGIQYLRIRDFQKNTYDSIKQALKNQPGEVQGVILDLRGNPGGLLDQSQKISDIFLTDGVIVSTKIGDSKKAYNAVQNEGDYSGKIVVLIDAGSASASEIVAGALKNNERAVLVGNRTFGKGSVQQIFDLNDGSALKLTIADYLTPGDVSIQDIGITPDISLKNAVVSKEAILFASSTEHKPKNSNGKPIEENPVYSVTFLDTSNPIIESEEQEEITPEEALSREEKRKKLDNDFFIEVAKEIIHSSSSLSRNDILDNAQTNINKLSNREEAKIEDKLNSFGIDWSVIKAEPTPIDILVNVSPPLLKAKAGEKLSVTVEVENKGKKPIYRLEALTESENQLFDGKEFIFGKLDPGEKGKGVTTFDIPKWGFTREDKITLRFKDANNSRLPDYSFILTTEQLPRPVFAYNYEIVDDGRYSSKGNGDGIPELGETIALLIRVKNVGKGDAPKAIVTLKNLSGDKAFLEKGRIEFENLKPNEVREEPLNFVIKKPDSKIELELQIIDEVFRDGIVKKISIHDDEKEHTFQTNSQNIVVRNDKTPIKGGSFKDAPVLAISEKGTGFETVGENEGWVKVKLNENLIGWVKKDDILFVDFVSSPPENNDLEVIFDSPPIIEIDNMPLSTTSSELLIGGSIKDNDGLELVNIFLGEDKVALIPSQNNDIPLSFKLKLNEGVNEITILAKDSKNLVSRYSFVVRKEA